MTFKQISTWYVVSDLFRDLVDGEEVFFIQYAVSKSVTKTPQHGKDI